MTVRDTYVPLTIDVEAEAGHDRARDHRDDHESDEQGAHEAAPCGDPPRRAAARHREAITFLRVEDDDRDVVDAAGAVRGAHEPVRGLLRIGDVLEDRLDLVLCHHPREAVRAEQHPVAVDQRKVAVVDVDVALGPDRARQHAPVPAATAYGGGPRGNEPVLRPRPSPMAVATPATILTVGAPSRSGRPGRGRRGGSRPAPPAADRSRTCRSSSRGPPRTTTRSLR